MKLLKLKLKLRLEGNVRKCMQALLLKQLLPNDLSLTSLDMRFDRLTWGTNKGQHQYSKAFELFWWIYNLKQVDLCKLTI